MTVPLSDFSEADAVFQDRSLYAVFGKRLFDVLLVLLALPVVAPLLAVILFMTWVQGGKPLFVQHRVGLGGKTFRCLKVRTMVKNADRVLADLIARDPAVAREWQTNQKLAKDPRITQLGRFLRRSSLDELPQLLNVLNGTMSLVGPRPFTPEQKSLYADGRNCAYYALRPGLSGLWQVSRRNAGSFAERVRFDEEYGRKVGLLFDIQIVWRTFSVVLGGTGI